MKTERPQIGLFSLNYFDSIKELQCVSHCVKNGGIEE